jgi:type IV pilus assembly protein PilV
MIHLTSGRRHRRQAGFSLLETLIAVLVLSVGVLGLAGLQFIGLKEGQTSYQRSQAVLLAYEIADRMRANRAAAATGAYALTSNASLSAPAANCASTACTAAQMASYDVYNWYQRVKSTLPSGTASIGCTDSCDSGRKQTVILQWDELRTGTVGSGCSSSVSSKDGCVAVNVAP